MCYNMITVLEVDYENPWIYEGRPFTSDDIGDYYGFVYRITNTTNGKQYIGRKYFTQKRKPKGGKRKVTSESDWKRYYGSSDDLKRDIREIGKDSFRREIISLHTTLGKVNYEETKQLFCLFVIYFSKSCVEGDDFSSERVFSNFSNISFKIVRASIISLPV